MPAPKLARPEIKQEIMPGGVRVRQLIMATRLAIWAVNMVVKQPISDVNTVVRQQIMVGIWVRVPARGCATVLWRVVMAMPRKELVLYAIMLGPRQGVPLNTVLKQ